MTATVAELDFPVVVGIDADPLFRAQALRASAPLSGGNTWVFFRNDAWPGSDIAARYAVGAATVLPAIPIDDAGNWYAEASLYAVDGSDSVAAVHKGIRKRMRAGTREERVGHPIGGFFVRSCAQESMRMQQVRDARYAELLRDDPWNAGRVYRGDDQRTLWAKESAAGTEAFPISWHDRGPGQAPLITALIDGSLSLTERMPDAIAASAARDLPAVPVRLRTYPLTPREDVRLASAQVARGERTPVRVLDIGAPADVRKGTHNDG